VTNMSAPPSFASVTVDSKANIYFDGNVISHTIHFADGTKKTLGVIKPGSYYFGTAAAEKLEIIAGSCQIKKKGSDDTEAIEAGSFFEVGANSGFDITVTGDFCQYICSYY
jgi:uncharacterized protein YaiE (UPF0345 family)